MSTDTYQNALARNLHQQLNGLEQHSSLSPQTVGRVATNIKHFLNGQRFAGWLRPLPNGQVLLLTSTYAPDNTSWAFHLHMVSSEGHYGMGHLLAGFIDYNGPKKLSIGDFKITDDYQNAGTGSWMMGILLDFCRFVQVDLIEGKIVEKDWDQVEMLEHFYTKHGFAVTPDQQPRSMSLKRIFHNKH
jgi:GNAT superfamily N-acetyltransferase